MTRAIHAGGVTDRQFESIEIGSVTLSKLLVCRESKRSWERRCNGVHHPEKVIVPGRRKVDN